MDRQAIIQDNPPAQRQSNPFSPPPAQASLEFDGEAWVLPSANKKLYNQLYAFRHGLAKNILLNKNDKYITGAVQAHGEFSEDEVDLFRDLIKPGDLVIDAGANFGCHTLALSEIAGYVLAVEPQWQVYLCLCANLALNCTRNVQALNIVLGAQEGQCLLPELDPEALNSFGSLHSYGHQHGQLMPIVPLDALALPQCNFIKLDVEGSELEVLQGAKGLLDKHSPLLYLEFTHHRQELLDLLRSLGYRAIRHLPDHNRTPNYLGSDVTDLAGSDMLLAYKEPPAPVEFLGKHGFTLPDTEDMLDTTRNYRILGQWI